MADIICRWRNGTPQTVVELVNKLPHRKMKSSKFREMMEKTWPGFFRAPYQLACQLALYCEAEDGYYYPRFEHDIDIEEAQKYLEHWINRYYIPNPYTGDDGFKDLDCPTYVIKTLYDYILSHPNTDYATAYKACFNDEAKNNDDIVRNYINRYSRVLKFSKEGILSKTDVNPKIIFGFMDRSNKKEFFDNLALPEEIRLMDVYNKVDLAKKQQMFYDYMKQKGLSDSSARQYAFTHAVNDEVCEIVKQVCHKKNLFEVIDVLAIQTIYNKVKDLQTNIKRNNALSATIKNYKDFIDFLETEKANPSELVVSQNTLKETLVKYTNAILDFSSFTPSQIIYYGAPGTGKSHTIKEKEAAGLHCIRTTFHPDSDYATFVGCYKPHRDRESGNLTYEFVEQAFLETYRQAWQNPQQEIALVIEEINRGNCAQIFGDIFQLLDRDDDGWSTYPIKADTDICDHLTDLAIPGYPETMAKRYGDDKTGYGFMAIPPNMSLLATMNTSDQSLFPIDSAFKRRWDWTYMKIKNHPEENYKIKLSDKEYDWWEFIQRINEIIASMTSSADKQLGYFFCKAASDGTISPETFVSKVIFYLWNDVFKDYGFEDASLFRYKNDKDEMKDLTFPDFYDEAGEKVNETRLKDFLDKVLNWKKDKEEQNN